MPTDTRTPRSGSARRRARNRRAPQPAAAARETTASSAAIDAAPPAGRPAAAAVEGRSFAELGVPAAVVAALADGGVSTPFPIQAATLPDTLAGRDVLGRGQTGSGKTIAFAVPTVSRLTLSDRPRRPGRPRALVLVPTRELANQVAAALAPLAAAMNLRTTTVFGGVGQVPQTRALRAGVDVLIACPGRLEDLIAQGHCDLGSVEVTVLDEADHMADLGFLPAVKRLLDTTPRDTQRLLFSATLDNGVDTLVRRYLTNPVMHSTAPAVAPVSTMTHHVLAVPAGDKGQVVRELAAGQTRTLLFARTKHGAKKLAKSLTAAGIPAVDLHGNLSQGARERNLAAFSAGTARVLVATDIAARGIHVDDVALVVHVDPPAEHKAYLHRSGRTARAGADGAVVTVMTPDQAGDVRTLCRQAGITPVISRVSAGDPAIEALTGPKAPFVEPVAHTPAPQLSRGERTGNRNGNGRRRRSGGGSTRGSGGNARSGGNPRSGGTARSGGSEAAAAGRAAQRRGRGTTTAASGRSTTAGAFSASFSGRRR
ncbi:DEAD/DEAH box helicase [Jiangella gansuensis]|uniref:DEAD/DEAH box helicase n=1 Tax=Jiangella gansuensis TaxID=281473 RepID=UPI0004B195DF|nr:DEAD/DEAH box helicase [Jiangella gansuensis]